MDIDSDSLWRTAVASILPAWRAVDEAEARLANVVGADRAREARAEAFAEATRTPWPNHAVVLERLEDAYQKAVAGADVATTAQ